MNGELKPSIEMYKEDLDIVLEELTSFKESDGSPDYDALADLVKRLADLNADLGYGDVSNSIVEKLDSGQDILDEISDQDHDAGTIVNNIYYSRSEPELDCLTLEQ